MQRVFLDTNIWIDYLWQNRAKRPDKTRNQYSSNIISLLEGNSEYEIVFTVFLISEISAHLRDWYLLRKIIADGFSYREFATQRKNYRLTDAEKEEIDAQILSISEAKDNVNTLSPENLSSSEIEEVLRLEAEFDIGFYDALHIHTASKSKCNFFVTKDEALRKAMSKLNQSKIIDVQCLPPKSFVTQLKR